jgi:hypothetical protein
VSSSLFFQLMAAGNRVATVSARPMPVVDEEGYQSPTWAYEVRYTGKTPERGIITVPPNTEELYLISRVLQDYFAAHPHDIVSA